MRTKTQQTTMDKLALNTRDELFETLVNTAEPVTRLEREMERMITPCMYQYLDGNPDDTELPERAMVETKRLTMGALKAKGPYNQAHYRDTSPTPRPSRGK